MLINIISLNSDNLSVKRWLFGAVFLLLFTFPFQSNAQTINVESGIVRIKLKPELVEKEPKLKSSNGTVQIGLAAIDALNRNNRVHTLRRVIPYSQKLDTKHRKYGLHQWYEIQFENTMDVNKVVAAYAKLPEVEIAEPIYEKKLIPYNTLEPITVNQSALKNTNAIFDDPYLEKQWHYINDGQTEGKVGADINIRNVWTDFGGSSEIIVSIHDEGVDYNHEDLKNNMWVNTAELNGEIGIDDDGNGYVDDIHGYNFGADIAKIAIGEHGTHVAGTVAAENNNGIGVCGVAGGTGNNDGVKMITCDIFGGTVMNTAASYVYAADNGAVISQNSWTYMSPNVYQQSILDAIDYFIAEAGSDQNSPMKGGVVIFAAGNDDSNEPFYPGAYDKVISVAALDHKNIKTTYSNYHPSVDLCAPGGVTLYNQEQGVLSTSPQNNYKYLQGTSMACPHVSGIAALIASKYRGTDLTNDDLIHRLLTGVRDVYDLGGNEDYSGLLGLGAIDAELTLVEDEGVAPAMITDLSLIGVGQDFATISWSVPSDEDNDKPNSFIIYYSEYPISDEEIAKAQKVEISNNNDAGELITYELLGLKPTTTYNIAVVSVDRWFNHAEYSNLVTGTTNEGPVVSVSTNKIDLSIIQVKDNPIASADFAIANSGEGLLKWSVEYFHSKNEDSYKINTAAVYPQIANTSGHIPNVQKLEANKPEIITQEQKPDPFNWMGFYAEGSLGYAIGDVDLSIPNSSATKFFVPFEDGFNLTMVDLGLNLNVDLMTNKPVIEVYRGEDLASAQLLLSQNFDAKEEGYKYYKITLKDQLFFSEGDYFWVVIHIPPGPLYPLGISFEGHSSYSDNCFMSFDMGESWQALEAAIEDDRLVWDIGVGALLKPLHEYITLMPEEGLVPNNEEQIVNVEVDASELINGVYDAALLIATNESKDTLRRVEVDFEVQGHHPELLTMDIINFGNVFYGKSRLLLIEVVNLGYGAFVSEGSTLDVQFSDPQFALENPVSSPLKGLSSELLEIRYTPSSATNVNATVTLNDKYGHTYTFNLYGSAIDPPKAVITPPENTFSNLTLGDKVNGSFTLSNEGGFPLKYYMPGFADGTNLGEEVNDSLSCKSGYIFTVTEGNEVNPAFEWFDIAQTGTPVYQNFIDDSRVKHVPVGLNFAFPFFGNHYDTLYVTRQIGLLSFDQESTFNTDPTVYHHKYNHHRYICAWGRRHDYHNNVYDGDIYYEEFPDRLIIQYDKIKESFTHIDETQSTSWDEPITFQIIIHANGDIDYLYKNLGVIPPLGYEATTQFSLLAIEDYLLGDGLFMSGIISGFWTGDGPLSTYPPRTGYKYSIKNPGVGMIESVSPAWGTIQVGESLKIDYTLNTEKLYVGDFNERMSIATNDHFNNPAYHHMNLNIIDGGSPRIEMTDEELNFGEVFQRDSKTLNVGFQNNGKAIIEIVTVESQNGFYTIDGYMPVVLKPKNKTYYTIDIITDEMGVKDDVLTFTDSDGNTYVVIVSGEVIDAPVISTDPISFSSEIRHGESLIKNLEVFNTGLSPMQFSVSGEEWLSVYPEGEDTYSSNIDYHVSSITDKDSPLFNWEDITDVGDTIYHTDPLGKDEDFWRAIKLPFSFSYYGVEYDTLYVGYSALISFTGGQPTGFFGQKEYAPSVGGFTNFIAPFHGFISNASLKTHPETGVYYHMNDDRIIIEWHEFINLYYMGDPLNIQLVLHKNGTFKFLYDFESPESAATAIWGGIAFENQDGTNGEQIAFWDNYFKDGMVITMKPKEYFDLAAQSSKDFNVVFDANNLFEADYSGNILLHNNTPDAPEYEVPVDLTIHGEAAYEIDGSLEIGEVMIVPEENDFREYDKSFTFINTGTKGILVKAVRLMNPSGYGGNTFGDDKLYGSGDSEDGWINISRRAINSSIQPRGRETFNLRIKPQSVDEFKDSVMILTDMVDNPIIKVPIHVIAFGAPKLDIVNDDMDVYANSDSEEFVRNITIDNTKGLSGLDYSLSMEYSRSVFIQSSAFEDKKGSLKSAAITQDNAPQLKGTALNTNQIIPSTFNSNLNEDFNRILFYADEVELGGYLGYGGGSNFYAGIAYTAPNNGFNLTHVQTHYTWGEHLETELLLEIRRGSDDLSESTVVYQQEYTHIADAANDEGELITIELDQNQTIFPNERFFIFIKYPSNLAYPQAYMYIDDILENTFFHGNGSEFAELRESSGFEYAANIIKACEAVYVEAGWAQFEGDKEGVVAAGEQILIPINYYSEQAEQGFNEAKVVIATNDPEALISEVPLSLSRNKGPQVQGIVDTELILYEGDTTDIEIHAIDLEGDNFTFDLLTDGSFVEANLVEGKYHLQLTPGYEDEGYYLMEVIMTDEYENTTTLKHSINVVHVNRAPEMINELGDQFMVLEQLEPYKIDLNDFIMDEDGDAVNFSINHTNSSVADIYQSGSRLIITPLSIGKFNLIVSATDPYFSTFTKNIKCQVDHRTGIDAAMVSDIKVYPNPINDILMLHLPEQLNELNQIRIVSSSGNLMLLTSKIKDGRMNVSAFNPGVYFIELSGEDFKHVVKFVKK